MSNNPFKDEEHVITDAEKENYQKNKHQKRQKIELSDAEVIQFAELMAANAPYPKFEQSMNLTTRDVQEVKHMLNIHDMNDAKEFLQGVDRNTMLETKPNTTKVEVNDSSYKDITDYVQKTGKRFRMTKDQKIRGLNRDQAFAETYGNGSN